MAKQAFPQLHARQSNKMTALRKRASFGAACRLIHATDGAHQPQRPYTVPPTLPPTLQVLVSALASSMATQALNPPHACQSNTKTALRKRASFGATRRLIHETDGAPQPQRRFLLPTTLPPTLHVPVSAETTLLARQLAQDLEAICRPHRPREQEDEADVRATAEGAQTPKVLAHGPE